jgi:mono/diheme cytochrome c family protein
MPVPEAARNSLQSNLLRELRRAFPHSTILILCAMWLTTAGPVRGQEPASAEAGRHLFQTVCVTCHTIGAGVKIGPDLKGVTERRDADWLRRFIRDPQQMRTSGDPTAKANLETYRIPMPNLALSEQQVEAAIAFLGAGEASPATRPPLYLPTLALAVLAAAGITFLALTRATKRVEARA